VQGASNSPSRDLSPLAQTPAEGGGPACPNDPGTWWPFLVPATRFQPRPTTELFHTRALQSPATLSRQSRRGAFRSNPTCGPPPRTYDHRRGLCAFGTYERLGRRKWQSRAFRWAYLPYAMHMGRPPRSVFCQHNDHPVKNYGCNPFIIWPATWPAFCKSSLSVMISTPPTRPRTLPETTPANWAMENGPLPQSRLYRKKRGLRDSRAMPQHVGRMSRNLSGTQFRKMFGGPGGNS